MSPGKTSRRSSAWAQPRPAANHNAEVTTAVTSCVPSERKSRERCSGAAWHTQKAPRPTKPKRSERGTAKASASTHAKGAAATS